MSLSAAHATDFYRDVAAGRVLWTIKDDGGHPSPLMPSGRRAMPFWSSEARALTVIGTVPAYAGFEPMAIAWSAFCERWVPGLIADTFLVGINWSGPLATGYDIEPEEVRRNVEALIRDGA